MCAAHGGITLGDEAIPMDQWPAMKSDKIPHLPFIKRPDEPNMFETEDILKHVATIGGKFEVNEATAALCHRANTPPLFIVDPYLNMPEAMWEGFGLPSKEEWIKMVGPELKKLADELGDKPFFNGDKPGYGEVFIWHNIDNMMLCCKEELPELSKLEAFHKRISELPGCKEYLAKRPKKFGLPDSKAASLSL